MIEIGDIVHFNRNIPNDSLVGRIAIVTALHPLKRKCIEVRFVIGDLTRHAFSPQLCDPDWIVEK